jgi:O-antigen/teichoic acid export membrane protein
LIANFYNDESLKSLLVISGFVLLINAFQIVQNAKIIHGLKFKRQSIFRLISVIIGSFIGIIFAYNGAGVWSLVYMQLTMSASLMMLYWIYEGVFFSMNFIKKYFKELYSFGVNTTLASLLNTAFDNIYQLVLGRYFSLNQVGFYYQAKRLQDVPGGIIITVTNNVVYPSLAKLQDNKQEFANVYNKINLFFLVILGFMSCFIYVYSEQIILILYGKEWLGSVFYMQMLTIASFFYFQELINRQIFKIFDKTKKILHLEIVKKGIQSLSIAIGIKYSDINLLIGGFVISSIIGYFINYYFSRKIIEHNTKSEFITNLRLIIVSIACVFITCNINNYIMGSMYNKLITIPFLLIIYWGGLYFLKIFNPVVQIKKLL